MSVADVPHGLSNATVSYFGMTEHALTSDGKETALVFVSETNAIGIVVLLVVAAISAILIIRRKHHELNATDLPPNPW